jgi:hypothetical protein
LTIADNILREVHGAVKDVQEISSDEIRHAAILGITTLGFPASMANISWVEDILK